MRIRGFERCVVPAAALALVLASLSCSGGARNPGLVGTSSGNVYAFIGDSPPVGTTILKFEITVTQAVLCPQIDGSGQCTGSPQPSLLANPVEIELKQLELESAFLSLKSVEVGTYAGVKLTFSDPELKILAADGTVQELESPALALNPATVAVAFTGPLNVTADANFGFLIDFNISDSIQTTDGAISGIAPVVSLVQLPAQSGENIEEIDDATGVISSLSATCPSGSFTLLDSVTGVPITNIQFDTTTEFEEDLTCQLLVNGQVVEVDVELRPGVDSQPAQFFAREIELVNPPEEDGIEGTVFLVNDATEFVILVERGENGASLPAGSFVFVLIDPQQTQFRIDDAEEFLVDPLFFASGADLLAGQRVEVDVEVGTLDVSPGGCSTLEDLCVAVAERIKLKKGTLTARVAGTNGPDFTLDQLPSLFGTADLLRPLSADCPACLVGSVLVTTSGATDFEDDLVNVASLNLGDIVTVRGLLLKNLFLGPIPGGGQPRLVAEKVRRVSP